MVASSLMDHKEGVRIPFPSKLKTILIFTQAHPPAKPAQPAQLEGPQAGPRALDISRPGLLTNQRAQWPASGWAMGLTPLGRAA